MDNIYPLFILPLLISVKFPQIIGPDIQFVLEMVIILQLNVHLFLIITSPEYGLCV